MKPMTDVKDMTFETAFSELETLVQQLETGDLPLETAMALFERGTTLVAHCHDKLDNAELKVRQLTNAGEGGEAGNLEEFLPADDADD